MASERSRTPLKLLDSLFLRLYICERDLRCSPRVVADGGKLPFLDLAASWLPPAVISVLCLDDRLSAELALPAAMRNRLICACFLFATKLSLPSPSRYVLRHRYGALTYLIQALPIRWEIRRGWTCGESGKGEFQLHGGVSLSTSCEGPSRRIDRRSRIELIMRNICHSKSGSRRRHVRACSEKATHLERSGLTVASNLALDL